MADPNVELIGASPIRIAGIDGRQLDVTVDNDVAFGQRLPVCWNATSTARIRIYLIDLPEGMSVPTLAISVIASPERFEEVLAQAMPILESIALHP